VVDGRANVWKRWTVWIAGAFILIGAPLSVNALTNYFSPDAHRKSTRMVPADLAPGAASRGGANQPLQRLAVAKEPTYRVSMIIQSSDAAHAMAQLVDDDSGEVVWVPTKNCAFERMQWRCRHANKWWLQTATTRPVEPQRPRASPETLPTQ
ncbi:MAG: hypothetical protein SXG53_22830, partial [Pseudomonadota bacterium]|nr:hypothetical protein [Pseudomonadota bacterium]